MLVVLALLACRSTHAPAEVGPASGSGSGASSEATRRLAVEGLRDVACVAEGCLVWRSASVAGAGPGSAPASTLAWWAADSVAGVPVAVEGGDPAAWGALRSEGAHFVVEGACGGTVASASPAQGAPPAVAPRAVPSAPQPASAVPTTGGGVAEGPATTPSCETRWTLQGPAPSADSPALSRRLVPDAAVPARPAMPPVGTFVDEAPAVREDAAAWTEAWNLGRARGWRSNFSRVVVAPGGSMLAYFRGPGGGTLVRSPGRGAVRILAPEAPASWPAWLAMHPTGTEAYLLPWPASVLVAVDPASLATRWSLPLEAPAHGLFVDPGGRWLLAEVAEGDAGVGDALTARWTDWPTPALHAAADDAAARAAGLAQAPDPARDEVLRTWERPPATSVSVIDLARGEETLRVPGSYRRWSILPDGRLLLATDRSVVIHRPDPPETP